MKYIYIRISAMLILTLALGCKKFIEIDPPKNQLVTSNVFNNNETANSAMLTIYSQIFSVESYRIASFTGLYGDELTNYSSGEGFKLYNNSVTALGSLTNLIWNAGYNYIYQANAIYEGCNQSTSLKPDVKKQLIGEALFIRAYWNFYLLNFYGDIPLITTTSYTVNANLSRSEKSTVYEQIVSDLKSAQDNLSTNYIGPDGISMSEERVRPNKATATALLARVYLYLGKYLDAETQATSIISNTPMYALTDLDKVFVKNSKEAIWQVMASNQSYVNTVEGSNFILTERPQTTEQTSVSSKLLNAFEPGDKRKTEWIGKYTDMSVTPNADYYFPYKYKIQFGSDLQEYSMFFRLAEQFLIRAEARNEQGNISGAVADLNVIRTRARELTSITPNPLPNLLTTLNKDQVKDAILKERSVELFTEQGHRWLDIKRLGVVDAVMNATTPLKGGIWKTEKQLWPIPQSEILNDPNLKQNPSYN